MTRIPISAEMSRQIAEKAVQYAREDVKGRGWKSSGALQPYFDAGEIGISSTVSHLLIQNRGFDPFLMYWVEGRTVPLSCKQGDGPHIRRGKDVGKPGWADIPHVGKVWRPQKWRHPGLAPKRFLESSISRAIRDSRPQIQADVMRTLRGET